MKLNIGDKAFKYKEFSQKEVMDFSELTNDDNPIHFDEKYAKESQFGRPIVQGPLVASLIGGVLGSKLPGEGTIYIEQETLFLKPVYIGQTVKVQVEVTKIREDKPIISLRTWVENEDAEIVIDGHAVVKFLKLILKK
jgi:acyl dehydratase